MEIREIKSQTAKALINEYHYSHRTPGIMYAYGLYENGVICGCVTYGKPSSPQVARSVAPDNQDKVLELNRLVITTSSKNAASFLVGNSLKMLPCEMIIVSYADGAFGHVGYVYQSTNFWYAGEVKAHDAEYVWNGKRYHPRTLASMGITNPTEWAKDNGATKESIIAKHRYIYFTGSSMQKKKTRKLIRWQIDMNYPKGDTARHEPPNTTCSGQQQTLPLM